MSDDPLLLTLAKGILAHIEDFKRSAQAGTLEGAARRCDEQAAERDAIATEMPHSPLRTEVIGQRDMARILAIQFRLDAKALRALERREEWP